ncbi:hypothetical protein [Amorphus sp. MBR-141]
MEPDPSEIRRLTPDQIAILSLSNPYSARNHRRSQDTMLLTSKEIYFWAFCICHFAYNRSKKTDDYPLIEDEFREIVNEGLYRILFIENGHRIKRGAPYSPYQIPLSEFKRALNLPDSTISGPRYSKWLSRVDEMEEDGLLEDPFEYPALGMGLFCLGLVPFSFTRRTEEGDSLYLKIKAYFWEVEYNRKSAGTEINVKILTYRLVQIFRDDIPKLLSSMDKERR